MKKSDIYALQVELTKNDIVSMRKEIAKKNSIFADKKYLDSLFLPSNIIGRKKQARQIIEYLESIQHGLLVPVISVYGRSGSGKSTIIKFVCKNMEDLFSYAFVNIRKARTVFGCANMVLAELGSEPLKSADGLTKAIETIGREIEEILTTTKKQFFVLVLDEYDVIFYDKRGNPSDFMYKLLTLEENLREKGLWLCVTTISNNALADYNLDDRVKSRMGNSEVFFDPYSENDVLSILRDRAKKAFVLMPKKDVLLHCARLSADSHGDARRAIDLLRIAGECSSGKRITDEDVKTAYSILQKDRLNSIVGCASHHQRNVIGAICINLLESKSNSTTTSEIYDRYCKMIVKEKALSYRRIVDLLVELVNTGLLSSRNVSRGRKGYGTEYTLLMPLDLVGSAIGEKWWESRVENQKTRNLIDDLQKNFRSRGRSRFPYSLMKYQNLLKTI